MLWIGQYVCPALSQFCNLISACWDETRLRLSQNAFESKVSFWQMFLKHSDFAFCLMLAQWLRCIL